MSVLASKRASLLPAPVHFLPAADECCLCVIISSKLNYRRGKNEFANYSVCVLLGKTRGRDQAG